MKCCQKLDDMVKKLHWYDMSLVKLSVMAITLMLAAIWPVIASLQWYWYAIIFVVTAIGPIGKILKVK